MSKASADKLTVENVNHPGHTSRVNAEKYNAMKAAYLRVLPASEPGLTFEQILERVVAHLPDKLFPGGAKSGWWVKTVQLDLEAKKVVKRENSSPLRWHRAVT